MFAKFFEWFGNETMNRFYVVLVLLKIDLVLAYYCLICLYNYKLFNLIFKMDTLLQNMLDQMLTFNGLSFCHFVQEVNDIWYLRRLIIALPGYQISLTSCTYKIVECQAIRFNYLIKIIWWESVPF